MSTAAKMKWFLIPAILSIAAIPIPVNIVAFVDKIQWNSSAIVKIPDMLELFVTHVNIL